MLDCRLPVVSLALPLPLPLTDFHLALGAWARKRAVFGTSDAQVDLAAGDFRWPEAQCESLRSWSVKC